MIAVCIVSFFECLAGPHVYDVRVVGVRVLNPCLQVSQEQVDQCPW